MFNEIKNDQYLRLYLKWISNSFKTNYKNDLNVEAANNTRQQV